MKYCSTAIFTKDISKSKQFYHDLIGLEIMMDNGTHIAFTGGLNIWDVGQADSLIFGELQPEASGHRVELCFDSADVEADYRMFQERGVEVLNVLAEQPWAQLLFRVYDPDGNIVEVAENITDTFRRLYEGGLTLEQVSERTFTTVADLRKLLGL